MEKAQPTGDVITSGCGLTWTQKLNINYYGMLYRLELLLDLLDIGSIVSVNTSELRHQVCLIQDILCKLEQIERGYERRDLAGTKPARPNARRKDGSKRYSDD